jgi:predicted nucleotidyltransferase
MSALLKNIEETSSSFMQEIKEIFNKDLISIILFGSAVTDDYIPKKSDLNFLIVLDSKGIQKINRAQKRINKWLKKKISPPLFLTKDYILSSLDSFPIEFLNMQSAYQVIFGKDTLSTLKLNKKDIRLQCERELKSKLLHLRQGYILTRGKAKALRGLIQKSIVTFTSIFKALLYLRGKEIPGTKKEVMITTCQEFQEIEESFFLNLLSIRESGTKLSKDELDKNVQTYIVQIEALGEAVDKMKV